MLAISPNNHQSPKFTPRQYFILYGSSMHVYLYYICTYVPSPSLVVSFISLFGSSISLHCFLNISIANNLSFIASRVFLATCKIANTQLQQYGPIYTLLYFYPHDHGCWYL